MEGFEQFASYMQEEGSDPAVFAADLSALWGFLADHPAVLESPELAESAARFVGNVISVVHPAATWRVTPELEVGTSTRSIPVAGLVRIMVEQPEQLDAFTEELSSWPQADQDVQETNALTASGSQPVLQVPPVPFTRPPFPEEDYRDADGQVIRYGTRWGNGGPPEEAYSRLSHLGRFAPLLLDLDALIGHLQTWYLVDVDRKTVDQETQLVLRPSTGATVAITATVESVRIQGGALFRAVAPQCSCDACDESAETAADHLEDVLLAIAAGGLREVFPVGHRRWQHTQLCTLEGERHSSNGEPDRNLTPDELEHITAALRELHDGWWPAWTLRADLTEPPALPTDRNPT
ncbi:DUF6226 family protein [Microbacterium sp. zg.Y909]|uniref:DUF6226 family protein n=1 Tax=Microbacterium sp. zg.Y909 TaxID=2969413 RepID=UPI00214C031B|nr:DUF6226 family protein [Microbacterium sp. zg.Y909]MCR2826498.1 DUF6226 family protein [Microbacterium sp. zg.Y909]